ncbi:MAG: S8 family serine peptidase [Bacteroidota bacterium]
MATWIYIIGYVGMTLSLGIWFFLKEKKRPALQLQRAFWITTALYALGVIINYAPIDYKMQSTFRDLMVLAGSGVVLALVFRLRKSMAIVLGLWIIAFLWYMKDNLINTYPDYTPPASIELDEQGELLIEIKEGRSISDVSDLLEKYSLEADLAFNPADKASTILDNYYVVDVPANNVRKLSQIMKAFEKHPALEWIEPNEVIQISPVETTKLPRKIEQKYGVNDPGIENLWGFEAMQMDKLYNYLRANNISPKKESMIAIIDTGVDSDHEDLKDNYTSINSKYDQDVFGHGTHCAGIAGAVTNNGVGIASYAPNNDFVQITSVRVMNAGGFGTQKTIVSGMIEAVDKGADVLSMSLGGRAHQSKQRAYNKAVQYANDKGSIVVTSAGNSNDNANKFTPANSDGVIVVSAIDSELKRAFFSNHISDVKMGITAPGVEIYSTKPNNTYLAHNGTSMSCPYVSGIIGMMKAIKPEINTQEAYKILNETGKNIKDTPKTGRLIQPYDAIKKLMEN